MFKAKKPFAKLRGQMVDDIRRNYGLRSPKVLSVMSQIPRHKFVGKDLQSEAYLDKPVLLGFGQTMSQPYTVAFMTHLLIEKLGKFNKVLEIGTGSGYQAAVLSQIFDEVYSIEVVPKLASATKKRLKRLGYENVFVKKGSGEWGWKEKAPYDAIIVTAGMEKVPKALFSQLMPSGVMVVPLGKGMDKKMTRFQKSKSSKIKKIKTEKFGNFHFVPFVREKN